MATYDSGGPVRSRHAAGDTDTMGRGQGSDRSWVLMLVGAAVTFVLGLIVVIWPHATLAVVSVLFGIQLLVLGIIGLIAGFTARGETGGIRVTDVVLGLLGILVGLYLIRHLTVTVTLLAILLGLYWVMRGIVDLLVAAVAGPVPGRWVKAAIGVISLAAGLIVLFKPQESLKFLLVILGIYLMLYGLMLAFWAFQVRRLAAQAADVS
jgi:uncharacterized membrane protein HdeD (DUF308 family)